MKSVLISIKPKWCQKIVSGEKTVEIRKTRPKLETPFRCYIYCTMPKTKDPHQVLEIHGVDGKIRKANGKVIGAFTCDRIYQYSAGDHVEGINISHEEMELLSCLTRRQIGSYETKGNPEEGLCLLGVYGWHISDLVIYDDAKELSEFTGLRKTKFGLAPVPVTRPPQSWCYVEELHEII